MVYYSMSAHQHFADRSVDWLTRTDGFRPDRRGFGKASIRDYKPGLSLDLVPFVAQAAPVTARPYFSDVASVDALIGAYRKARRSLPFEDDVPGLRALVHPYAGRFLEDLFTRAGERLDDEDARRIAEFAGRLDVYCAVKSVESLLNSRGDCVLLRVAEDRGWTVHFDHVAIRCGSNRNRAALTVAKLACECHGYVKSQLRAQRSYRFTDGWRAYPVYKILENGVVLRLFIDESEADAPAQIIQHWNRVYGFTAHHLALRFTRQHEDGQMAIPLSETRTAFESQGVTVMAPTGGYTRGLLEQAFTEPSLNKSIPSELKFELRKIDPALEKAIENGKLIELVSRRETPPALAREFFSLFGIRHQTDNPLHSVPIYQYFLPEQAAHVIRTSVQVRQNRAA